MVCLLINTRRRVNEFVLIGTRIGAGGTFGGTDEISLLIDPIFSMHCAIYSSDATAFS